MASHPPDTWLDRLTIRSYRSDDQADVAYLYTHGLLAGQIAPNDTGADIENVREAYFDHPRHHLWVAEVDQRVVGMVAVISDEDHTAEVRRLRVHSEFQKGQIAGALVEHAIAHCKHHGFLKVRLDTRFEKDAAMDIFDRIGFQHTRSRTVNGQELLEFYLDLYRQERPD